jgi:hypothetical protein
MSAKTNAYSHYTFKTKDVAAELNLTWECDLSSVMVYYLHPTTFKKSQLILSYSNAYASANNWECGTRQLIIPPYTTFRVMFLSVNELGGFYSSDRVRNEGGAFEIDIRPIEASD